MHKRNKHRGNYDFEKLIETLPELKEFVKPNKYNHLSINFFDPLAVKALNKSLLKHYYDIKYWDIPQSFLCPPIPSRADYIHYIADLLANQNNHQIPQGKEVRVLDIGVGANCIYPIIGNAEYGWSFVGADLNKQSIQSAQKIVDKNEKLNSLISLRLQKNTKHIFKGIIAEGEHFDLSLCNPPFHSSFIEAQKGTLRKLNNLKGKGNHNMELNFGGQSNELWCDGGELRFIKTMIIESKSFQNNVNWFSSLISKEAHLKSIYQMLKKAKVCQIKTLKMEQGNKQSRVVAWSYKGSRS